LFRLAANYARFRQLVASLFRLETLMSSLHRTLAGWKTVVQRKQTGLSRKERLQGIDLR